MALFARGAAQQRKAIGTVAPVQNQLARKGALYGARLGSALATIYYFQGAEASNMRVDVVNKRIWLKVNGVWKMATPWIKVNGVWKLATPNIKVSGQWK